MKTKVLLTTLFAFVLLTANAQFRKVPVEVTNSFKQKYADAANVSWKSGLTTHKANYELNGISIRPNLKTQANG
jgi:hypothetical protein